MKLDTAHAHWPADRFLWAVLDGNGWDRTGPLPEGMLPLLADEVPTPVEDLHAVGAPDGDGRLVVCAVRRSALDALDPGVLSLCPESLPPFAAGAGSPGVFNLLAGEFEPLRVRKARQRAHALAAGTFLVATALVALGLERRADRWEAAGIAADQAITECLEATGAPPEYLGIELDRLRALAAGREGVRPVPDAAPALAGVLAAWPAQTACTTHTLTAEGDSVALVLSVEGDPTALLAALRPPEGWVVDEPRLHNAEGVTRVSLRMRPEGKP